MTSRDSILKRIKQNVHQVRPGAKVILFGSYARGDNNEESDIDLLILVNEETISFADEKKITYPLYELEFKTGLIMSPIVKPLQLWENKYRITPLFENIKKEGIEL